MSVLIGFLTVWAVWLYLSVFAPPSERGDEAFDAIVFMLVALPVGALAGIVFAAAT